MMLVDVHTHLDDKQFVTDLDLVIENAKKNGLKRIITNGTSPESNRQVLEITKKYDIVYGALGIYPPDILYNETKESDNPIKLTSEDVDKEIEWIKKTVKKNDKIVSLGEVGLDKSWDNLDFNFQKETFQKFIELSEKTRLPLTVHSRKAELEVIEMLESSNAKNPIIHCFGGKFKLVERIQDNRWNFSIPTNVVRSEHFQKIVKTTKLGQLFTETDAPYLGPVKTERNEPKNILQSIQKIAEIKKITPEEASNQIFFNYQRTF